MTSVDIRSDPPEFIADEESASIYPLLTPSPSEAQLICQSPEFPTAGNLMLKPGFMQDPESVSMCPLLESSPPPEIFRHPLDPLGALQYSQDDLGNDLPSYVGLAQVRDSRSSSIPDTITKRGSSGNNLLETSSSSSSSALQENPACVQLLNHHYQHLSTSDKKEHNQFIQQENGTTLEIAAGKIPATDHFFIHWNWPVIRTACFWTVLSLTVACVCIVIGMIATVPSKCYPQHQWYQGGVFYEIFPASFQDGTYHDGIGDLPGIAGRTSYFVSLGISAVRLNSIFPSENYPEDYEKILNLTGIDHRLGSFRDMQYLISTLHKQNISIILDLPIYPFVKVLGSLKTQSGRIDGPTLRKENIADKISSVVHNHRSHREVQNETDVSSAMLMSREQSQNGDKNLKLNPYIDGGISGLMKVTSEHLKAISRTVVEDALHYWFGLGIDGIYIKGIEQYIDDPMLLSELQNWNRVKSTYSGMKAKILMADYAVLERCNNSQLKDQIKKSFDLLDVYLDFSNGTKQITEDVIKYGNGETSKQSDAPWIHWNIGNINTERLANRVINNAGCLLFQSLLPGTVSIFYGDEIGMSNSLDPHGDHADVRHRHQLIPMKWVNDVTQFTLSTVVPWLPYGESDSDSVLAKTIIRNLTELRSTSPSIYMNSIAKEGKIILNFAMRYSDESMVTIERFYPRRNTYVAIYNTGHYHVYKDLSHVYYGGEVAEDSEGDSGNYISFKDFSLRSGEAVIVKMDK